MYTLGKIDVRQNEQKHKLYKKQFYVKSLLIVKVIKRYNYVSRKKRELPSEE